MSNKNQSSAHFGAHTDGALPSSGPFPDAIIWQWLVSRDSTLLPQSSFFSQVAPSRGCHLLLLLVGSLLLQGYNLLKIKDIKM